MTLARSVTILKGSNIDIPIWFRKDHPAIYVLTMGPLAFKGQACFQVGHLAFAVQFTFVPKTFKDYLLIGICCLFCKGYSLPMSLVVVLLTSQVY